MQLFIDKCKDFYGIEKIFGTEGKSVFQDISKFYLVLNGIALLSSKAGGTEVLKKVTFYSYFFLIFHFIYADQSKDRQKISIFYA